MKHKILSKKANMAVSKAIKIITSVVLGSALMAGLCVTVKQTVLPTTTTKVESMFGITGDITEDLGGGVFPTTDRFEDGPCVPYYYDTLQNAVADASAHTTANANADENTANAVIDVRQSDDMYIVKPTKDQTIASSLAISNKVIFDANGKQIQLTAGAEFKPQAGSEVTFRDSGTGKIYKDINGTKQETLINMLQSDDSTLNILNGTYEININSKVAILLATKGKVNIKGGTFSSKSGIAACVITTTQAEELNITGGNFISNADNSFAAAMQLYCKTNLSNCNIIAISDGGNAQPITINNNANVTINSSKIVGKSTSKTSDSANAQTITIRNNGINTLMINDSTIVAQSISEHSNRKYYDFGIYNIGSTNNCIIDGTDFSITNKSGGSIGIKNVNNVENCTVETSTTEGKVFGLGNVKTVKNSNIRCWATNDSKTHTAQVFGLCYDNNSPESVLLENTSVICDYNLENVSVADDYSCEGIQIPGSSSIQSLTINNCNIKATREALSLNAGNTCISGGTYEGIQHGGAYFNSPKVVVRNATFRKWNYDGQFNKNNFYSYNAAFYIGNPNHEVKVYMDNCKLENATNAVLSSSYSYKNTYLYASNTSFNNIRIDGANSNGNKGHMYIGKGTTYQSTSGSGELDTVTYVNTEFTPEYVKNNFN